jgi:Domain of unknown function (DUF4398)
MNTSMRTIAKVAAGAATVLITACATTPAPTEQMAVARAAVADADASGAATYDAVDIRNAHDKLDAATIALGANHYERARRYAEEAEADANLAATRSRSAKTQRAVAELRESLRALRAEISRSGS